MDVKIVYIRDVCLASGLNRSAGEAYATERLEAEAQVRAGNAVYFVDFRQDMIQRTEARQSRVLEAPRNTARATKAPAAIKV